MNVTQFLMDLFNFTKRKPVEPDYSLSYTESEIEGLIYDKLKDKSAEDLLPIATIPSYSYAEAEDFEITLHLGKKKSGEDSYNIVNNLYTCYIHYWFEGETKFTIIDNRSKAYKEIKRLALEFRDIVVKREQDKKNQRESSLAAALKDLDI